jgi:hypothetical protein
MILRPQDEYIVDVRAVSPLLNIYFDTDAFVSLVQCFCNFAYFSFTENAIYSSWWHRSIICLSQQLVSVTCIATLQIIRTLTFIKPINMLNITECWFLINTNIRSHYFRFLFKNSIYSLDSSTTSEYEISFWNSTTAAISFVSVDRRLTIVSAIDGNTI